MIANKGQHHELKMSEGKREITLEDLLIDVWDEVKERIEAMRPTWQKFLTEYVRNGYNESKAYLASVNRHVTDSEAQAAGAAILRTKDIDFILGCMREKTNHSAIKVMQTLQEGLLAETVTKSGVLIPDHRSRVAAAEALAKAQKVNPPEEIKDSRFDSLLELMEQSTQRDVQDGRIVTEETKEIADGPTTSA